MDRDYRTEAVIKQTKTNTQTHKCYFGK